MRFERGLAPAVGAHEVPSAGAFAADVDVDVDFVVGDRARHQPEMLMVAECQPKMLFASPRDDAPGVEHVAPGVARVGKHPRFDETGGGMRKLVVVLAFAEEIGGVELVDHALFRAQRARELAVAERVPIGAVDDLLGASADHVAVNGNSGDAPPEPAGRSPHHEG